jgi:hypothetical protein
MNNNHKPDYVDIDRVLDQKTFFILHIYSGEDPFYLVFRNEHGQQYIAGRGMPGETLRSAISRELLGDLGIMEWKLLHPILFSDMTKDKQGNDIERIRVEVKTPYFDIPEGKKYKGLDAVWEHLDA